MEANNLTPFVYWGQTSKTISLKVDLRNVENIEVTLTEETLTFCADGLGIKGHHKYDFEIDFYLTVIPEKSQYRKTDLAVEFQIEKRAPETWPRLTAQKLKLPWLKIDFDKFLVEKSDASDADDMKNQSDLIDKVVTEIRDPRKRNQGGMPSIKTSYLFVYNLFQCIGFTYILGALLVSYVKDGPASKEGAFETAGSQLMVCQLVAILEVVHAMFGLVKSNVLTTLMQIAGRNFMLFMLILQEPKLQLSTYCWYLFVVWSAIEVIRYPFYLLQLVGLKLRMLTWLRYTVWIPLYPLGILIESVIVFNAIYLFGESGYFSFQLPNSANFVFNFPYFLWAYLIIIAIGASSNLKYMWLQRQKQLSNDRLVKDVRKKA